jgi:tight adherence protein B
MTLIGILLASIIGLAIIAFFFGLWNMLPRNEMSERMYDLIHSTTADTGGSGKVGSSGLSAKEALTQLDQELLSHGLGKGITANLIQANLKITATEYVLIIAGITILGALLGYTIAGHPVSALLAGVIGFFIPPSFVTWQKAKRRRLFGQQLPEALTQLAGSLRAGYSLLQSLDVVTKQIPWPASEEFVRVVREVQLGQSLNTALGHLAERITSDDLVMVISSINIHQQVGGNLAEILDTVGETLRERARIKREVDVLTAQQRISGYVLVALPIALGAFLLIINPEYEMRLFTPGPTLCIPVGAVLGIIVGYILMRRIVDIDV